MSEKDMELNEMDPARVTLTDEEGVERDFDIIGTMELDGCEYFALVAVDGAEDEYIILKAVVEDGEEVLITIDDDDEFEEIAEIFEERLADLYEIEELEQPGE